MFIPRGSLTLTHPYPNETPFCIAITKFKEPLLPLSGCFTAISRACWEDRTLAVTLYFSKRTFRQKMFSMIRCCRIGLLDFLILP